MGVWWNSGLLCPAHNTVVDSCKFIANTQSAALLVHHVLSKPAARARRPQPQRALVMQTVCPKPPSPPHTTSHHHYPHQNHPLPPPATPHLSHHPALEHACTAACLGKPTGRSHHHKGHNHQRQYTLPIRTTSPSQRKIRGLTTARESPYKLQPLQASTSRMLPSSNHCP